MASSRNDRTGGGAPFTVPEPTADDVVSGGGEWDRCSRDECTSESAADKTGLRVLFIDDEPSLCALVRQYFSRLGHHVEAVSQPQFGLETALAEEFDAIICDMRMPGLTGEELCAELLRQRPAVAGRILVATGDTLSPQTQSFFDRTGLPHIHKPFKLEELHRLVIRMAAGHPADTG